MRRVGVLLALSESEPEGVAWTSALQHSLKQLGWIDGTNIRIDYRWSGTDPTRMEALAKELVGLQPDLIVGQSTPSVRALLRETGTISIVFVTVAGEEQGLYGSTFLAAQFKAAGTDIQAMFSNDIIGTGNARDGHPVDPHTVRLFVEGVPTSETPGQAAIRQSVGGENDGSSRQLGRFAASVAENSSTDMKIRVVWRRDRFLRGGDHFPFLDEGWAALRFTEPVEDWRHQHQDVRVENGVQFGDLEQFLDYDYIANVARVNLAALAALERPGPTGASRKPSTRSEETAAPARAPRASAASCSWRAARRIGRIVEGRSMSSPTC